MLRFLSILALLTTATSSLAYAGGYVGAGMGSESGLHGDISRHFSTDDDSGSSRLHIGQRTGPIALEAGLFNNDMLGISDFAGRQSASTLSLGVDLKFYMGLVGGLEAFLKAGLNKTWLNASDRRPNWDYSGRGYDLGVGLQYRFELPLTEVGLWLDYTRQTTELRDGTRPNLDGRLSMLHLGISVGF